MTEMFSNYPDLLTVSQLQKALQIGRNQAYSLLSNNKIKHFKTGRAIKIPKKFLIDFVVQACYDDSATDRLFTVTKEG